MPLDGRSVAIGWLWVDLYCQESGALASRVAFILLSNLISQRTTLHQRHSPGRSRESSSQREILHSAMQCNAMQHSAIWHNSMQQITIQISFFTQYVKKFKDPKTCGKGWQRANFSRFSTLSLCGLVDIANATEVIQKYWAGNDNFKLWFLSTQKNKVHWNNRLNLVFWIYF